MSTDFTFEISANLRAYLRRNGSRAISVARAAGYLSSGLNTEISTDTTTRLIYTIEVLQDSPIGYFRFDEAVSSDPAADSSGNAHDGIYAGTVTTCPGNVYLDNDTAMDFDGGTGYFYVAGLGSVHTYGVLEGAFKVTWDPGGAVIRDGSTGSSGWGIFKNGDNFTVRVDGVEYDTGVGAGDYSGIWTHMLLRKDDDVLAFYINGTSVFTILGVSGAAASSPDWYVMKDGLDSTFQLGRADEIAIYDTSMSHARAVKHGYAYAGIPG